MAECEGTVCTETKTASRMGVQANEIVRFAEEERIELIIMGTHGWTGFRHLILGSTAENVVRMAGCPVLDREIRRTRPARSLRFVCLRVTSQGRSLLMSRGRGIVVRRNRGSDSRGSWLTWRGSQRFMSQWRAKKKPGHPGNHRVWLFLLISLSRN